MHVLALEVEIRIPQASSLKDKRRVVDSLLERTRVRLGVSAAEVGHQESHELAVLGFAVVSSSPKHCHTVMERVESLIWSRPDLEVVDSAEHWLE